MKFDIVEGICNECYKENHKMIVDLQDAGKNYHETMGILKLEKNCLYFEASDSFGCGEAALLCEEHLKPYLTRLREINMGRN